MANTLTRVSVVSNDLDTIEKVSAEFVSKAKAIGVRVIGPARLTTKALKITTPVTTFTDGIRYCNFEILIYQRVVEIYTTRDVVEQQIIGNTRIRNVDIDVTVVNYKF